MADSKESAPAPEMPAAEPGVSPKLLMGIMALNLVVMVAVVVILFMAQKKKEGTQSIDQVAAGAAAGGEHGAGGEQGGGGGHGAAPADAAKSDVRFFSAGDFTANLSGAAATHYVKVNVNLELSKEVDEDEMKKRKPQVRDRIISLLNGKKPADLQTTDGRNFLKEEIKTVVNGLMQSGKIDGVYFSTFIIN